MQCRRSVLVVCLGLAIAPVVALGAQQSDVSFSPFINFPGSGLSPVAGASLTLAGNTTFGLRGGAHIALQNRDSSLVPRSGWIRPWGADADALISMGGRAFGAVNRSPSAFVFAGVGVGGRDSAGMRFGKNWSYGAGTMLPLGSRLDMFGETRKRIVGFVLPTSKLNPVRTREFRLGMSVHLAPAAPGYRGQGRPR
jgi:hypothetical protein